MPSKTIELKPNIFFFLNAFYSFGPNGYDFPTLHVSRRFDSRKETKN